MRRSVCAAILIVIGAVWAASPWRLPDGRIAAAAGEAPHFGEGGVPQFELDKTWPKLPSKYRMGFGSAVTGDDQGHIWILSRPKTLANPRAAAADTNSTPAPPVMEFD